ncbi:hypothetical protein N0V90_009725 [Kalmusia sp. IMI 367209]|nr:hypothetical protein N0V90_009725 [Kalmusia sp. IMI 367209]
MASTPELSPIRLDPKIRYYILRQHGNAIVPLIPADQLPFQFKGFPKNLNHRQLSEGGWKFLDETPEIPFPLAIAKPRSQPPVCTELDIPKHTVAHAKAVQNSGHIGKLKVSGPPNVMISNTNPVQSLTDNMAAIYNKDARRIGYTKLAASSTKPIGLKKEEHCRHWVKTGRCIFAQECWYRHKMPSMEKLTEMGFVDIPRWYRGRGSVAQKGPNQGGASKLPHSSPKSPTQTDTTKKSLEKEKGTKSNAIEPQVSKDYGYKTNTANEPMLIDFHDPSESSQGSTTDVDANAVKDDRWTQQATPISVPPSSGATNPTATPTSTTPGSPRTISPSPTIPPKDKQAKKARPSSPTKTLRKSADETAKKAKLLAKRKVSSKKGCKLSSQPTTAPAILSKGKQLDAEVNAKRTNVIAESGSANTTLIIEPGSGEGMNDVAGNAKASSAAAVDVA